MFVLCVCVLVGEVVKRGGVDLEEGGSQGEVLPYIKRTGPTIYVGSKGKGQEGGAYLDGGGSAEAARGRPLASHRARVDGRAVQLRTTGSRVGQGRRGGIVGGRVVGRRGVG